MKPDISQLDPDQGHALELMLAGGNVCLGGRGGSGKSVVVEHYRDLCTRRTAFLAPTGLAALNIGGCTIHRFLGIPAAMPPPGYMHPPTPSRRAAIEAVEAIVIDEISMVSSPIFQTMADMLAAVPLPGCTGMPFGGRQIIVCGDFFQLPPVVPDEERPALAASYGGVFAFCTLAWHMALFQTAWLGHSHRQGMDREFVDALDAIRTGWRDPGRAGWAIAWLNRNATITPVREDCSTLCTTRLGAAAMNARRDAQLPSPPHTFNAVVNGPYDERSCPAEMRLQLRVGSRVMLLANGCTGEGTVYVNGDTGVVTGIDPGQPAVGVLLDDGRVVGVGPHRWLEQEYQLVENAQTGEEELELVTIASLDQMPLKLAYAVTIHKSQGMSLPRVHVSLEPKPFACGQLYVALSRCQSLEGLSLSRRLWPWDVLVDREVIDFHECALGREFAGSHAQLPAPGRHLTVVP